MDPMFVFVKHMHNFDTFVGGFMHHFTNIYAIEAILKSEKLRMTRYDVMCNDHNEGRYILKLYDQALNDLYGQGKIEEDFYEKMQNPKIDFKRPVFFEQY